MKTREEHTMELNPKVWSEKQELKMEIHEVLRLLEACNDADMAPGCDNWVKHLDLSRSLENMAITANKMSEGISEAMIDIEEAFEEVAE